MDTPTYPRCERIGIAVVLSPNGYRYCPRELLNLALSALQLRDKFWMEFGPQRHQANEGPFAADVEAVLKAILKG